MYLIRLLIIGDTSVGKTSLLLRFNDNNFVRNQKTTIGVDYKAKELKIGEEMVKMQIWDTAGQERFRSMTSAFYNRAQGVVLTFDVGNRESFLSLPSWIRDVKRDAPKSCGIFLCANKTDLDEESWQVRRDEMTNFAEENGYMLFETSASSGRNVQEAFIEIGKKILTDNRQELAVIKMEQRENIVLFDASVSEQKEERRRCAC